jgi:hypothetical protein
LKESYQAFLIQTTMARTYRDVQAEWQERLLEVGIARPVKK